LNVTEVIYFTNPSRSKATMYTSIDVKVNVTSDSNNGNTAKHSKQNEIIIHHLSFS